MKILVFDLETTGLDCKKDKIVEVGIISLDLETGEKEILFDKIVHERPITKKEVESAWIVTSGFMTVDEIRNSSELKDFAVQIQRIIDSYPDGITAFNNQFDFGFMERAGFKLKNKLACPMRLMTNICKLPSDYGGFKWPKVQEAYEFLFGKETGYVEKHRGADDAFHEADIVFELYKRGVFKVQSIERKPNMIGSC